MYADEIRRQAEVAPCAALPAVTAALWRAYGEGKVTEAEAEALSGLIEARTLSTGGPRSGQSPNGSATVTPRMGDTVGSTSGLVGSVRRPGAGSRPRTDASMERRRRWAASGRLPPGLAARFTLAETAVLALVAAEVARRGDCRLAIDNLAAVTGVSRTTVKNAIREATRLGLLTVEERQVTGWRNDTNVVRITSREWTAWLQLARRTLSSGRGVKSATTTHTQVLDLGESRKTEPKKGCRGAAGDLDRSGRARIREGGGGGRAMR
ncbi:helix-turn-helix domain-containing protein [Methylobacterium sp. J-030]|uniref:helix-turn-helix domain-containing protein n=1 Tax=Methylobacterium sp. J-030 TaxID=2836627 RepID=UPI001FB9DA4B|nr:helix-turn-helix domain-containing protein [Methylobacterium sp. J-030]MCJ2072455.1 helix-turn-helix domain-containing protein [Methylobacterium sp. J-030]